MYIYFLLRLEVEEEYKNYSRIAPKCFNSLFVPLKDNITKQNTTMRDPSILKLKLAAETFHVYLFVVLFYQFFFMWQFKILIECFSSK